jgi:hypothetical protein
MTTVQQLREALRENGLPTSGNKQELLKRLGTIGKPSASNGSTSEGYGSATTPTPSYSSWKLAQIRSELRRRQLPVSGNKDSLVDRLKQHDVTLSATKIEPSAHNFSPKIKPPTPHADPAIHNYPQAELESQQEIECSRLTIWRQPLRTLWYLSKGISFYAVQLLNYGKHHRLTILMMALALLSAAVVHFIESPYQSVSFTGKYIELTHDTLHVVVVSSSRRTIIVVRLLGYLGNSLFNWAWHWPPYVCAISRTAYRSCCRHGTRMWHGGFQYSRRGGLCL